MPGDDLTELRRDPLTGQEVIVAPARGDRPQPHGRASAPEAPAYVADCPLCPGNERETPPTVLELALPGSKRRWDVRVVPNLYPAVSETSNGPSVAGARRATGIHEVVVETPLHNQEAADRGRKQTGLWMEALRRRFEHLEARPATRYVSVFKNKGNDAGASLGHPHSQIVALDFLPAEVRRWVNVARRHARRSGGCLVCSLVAEERRAGTRLIFETDGFVAYAPFASCAAGEVLLVPLDHAASFAGTSPADAESLGGCVLDLLRRTRDALGDPDYNLVLHSAPARPDEDAARHWYWRLIPRLTRVAGLELGTGLNVNPLPPEQAAALLREAAADYASRALE